MRTDRPLGYIIKRKKRKKENVQNQNSFGSASRRTPTEKRKTKKNLFLCFYGQGWSVRIGMTTKYFLLLGSGIRDRKNQNPG